MDVGVGQLRQHGVVQRHRIRRISSDHHISANLCGMRQHVSIARKAVEAELEHVSACGKVRDGVFADGAGECERVTSPVTKERFVSRGTRDRVIARGAKDAAERSRLAVGATGSNKRVHAVICRHQHRP